RMRLRGTKRGIRVEVDADLGQYLKSLRDGKSGAPNTMLLDAADRWGVSADERLGLWFEIDAATLGKPQPAGVPLPRLVRRIVALQHAARDLRVDPKDNPTREALRKSLQGPVDELLNLLLELPEIVGKTGAPIGEQVLLAAEIRQPVTDHQLSFEELL